MDKLTQYMQGDAESNRLQRRYDPQEPVTITLTREKWHKIANSLKNEADQAHAFAVQFTANCDSKEFAAETIARYVRNYETLDALRAEIEEITMEPWIKRKEEQEDV